MSEQVLMNFSEIAGNETVKKALLCAMVNRRIKGILISGSVGTGKTSIMRSLRALNKSTPIVNVPVGTSCERLFGTINIAKAITTGMVEFEPGLLKDADEGFLAIDDIDLMEIRSSIEVLESAIEGKVILESEGLSSKYETNTSVIATTGISPRSLNAHLADRFDICVRMTRPEEEERAKSILRQVTIDGNALDEDLFDKMDSEIANRVDKARKILPDVKLLKRHRDSIARICVEYHVEGYRGPISCAETAVALAALEGRRKTSDSDIESAAIMCLNHRRNVFEIAKKPASDKIKMWGESDIKRFIHDDRRLNTNSSIVDNINSKSEVITSSTTDESSTEDFEPETLETKVGRRFNAIDIMESEDFYGRCDDTRCKRFVECDSGKYSGSRIPRVQCQSIAIDATVRAAAIHQSLNGGRDSKLKIKKDDIREKIRTRRVEHTFYFMVDASGSLIIRNRISKVKAAIMSMLMIHYEKRDRVGLMTFNEEKIEQLMTPTRAINEVSKIVETIKIGCGTPLSKAFMTCWSYVDRYTDRHPEGFVHIILFTDGKATKSINPESDPCEEALKVASSLRTKSADWIVIDTGLGTTKNDMPTRLAEALDGRLFMLDELESRHVVEDLW